MTKEEWVQAQLANAPAWTEERLARLSAAVNSPRLTEDQAA